MPASYVLVLLEAPVEPVKHLDAVTDAALNTK